MHKVVACEQATTNGQLAVGMSMDVADLLMYRVQSETVVLCFLQRNKKGQ